LGLFAFGLFWRDSFKLNRFSNLVFSPVILIPFGMFAFGCLLTSLAFKGESKNSKDFLAQLFEGQENFQRQKDAEL
jgi:hypothetical protein